MTQAQSGFQSRPAAGPGEPGALSDARDWLRRATERHVMDFALGEERRFNVDQDRQTLSLTFADDHVLALASHALGSFNPANGTFRWAWSNSSILPEFARRSQEAKSDRQVSDYPSFSVPIFQATFEDCCGMVALAAKICGCVGVYRAITEDHVSVFLGYDPPSDQDVARLWASGRAAEQDLIEATDVVLGYDAAMLPFDVEYNKWAPSTGRNQESEAQLVEAASRRLRETHTRFWRRDDDYWDPALAWPSPHDPATRTCLIAAPRRAGGVYVVRGNGDLSREAFVLQRFSDGMRIVDCDLDWGAGLLPA